MKKNYKNKIIITSILVLIVVVILTYHFAPFVIRHFTDYHITFNSLNILKGEITGLQIQNKGIEMRAIKVNITEPFAILSSKYFTDIEITEPVIHLTSIYNRKSNAAFLKNLPKIKNLSIERGAISYSSKDLPYEIKISNLRIHVKDYETAKGGLIDYYFTFTIDDTKSKSPLTKGILKGAMGIKNPINDMSMQGNFTLFLDSMSHDEILLTEIRAKGNFTYNKGIFKTGDLSVSSKGLSLKTSNLTFNSIGLTTDLLFDMDKLFLSFNNFKGKMFTIGDFGGNLSLTLKDTCQFKGDLSFKKIDIKKFYELIKPIVYKNDQDIWNLEGLGIVKINYSGYFVDSTPYLKGTANVELIDGAFSSSDLLKAGQGIKAKIQLELQEPQAIKKKSFLNLQSRLLINRGEYLIDNFYLNQGDRTFEIDSNISLDLFKKVVNADVRTDLLSTGIYHLIISFNDEDLAINGNINNLQLDKFYHNLLKDALPTIYPFTKDLAAKGQLDIFFSGNISNKIPSFVAAIYLLEGYLALPLLDFTVKDLTIKSPFLINTETGFESDHTAQVHFSYLDYKGLKINSITIPLKAERNRLVLKEALDFEFLMGKASLRELNLGISQDSNFTIKTSLELKGAKTSLLTEVFGFGAFGGSLDAYISELELKGSNIYTDGFIKADVFGGNINITNFNGNLQVKTFGADLEFKEIDLEKLTETIKIGKITGIVEGALRDFQIQYGQAARFILDIDSVKRDGIKQTVSTDAVESISILGTGSEGISKLLSTGINQFFKEFPYSKIGIRCELNNDVFTIRGKIFEGGKEYLIRKGFLRGIDVINQNPDNQISFKDMQKRLSIIFDQ